MAQSVCVNAGQFLQYYDELLDYISLKIGNRQLAKDVVQETYLKIMQHPEQFIHLIQPAAFLKKVSIHIAFDLIKKNKNYDKYFDAIAQGELEVLYIEPHYAALSEQELSVARQQYTQHILQTLAGLNPVAKDIFMLVQFHGMTQVDVAKQLGISRTMVIRHFSRALQNFSQIFEEEPQVHDI